MLMVLTPLYTAMSLDENACRPSVVAAGANDAAIFAAAY